MTIIWKEPELTEEMLRRRSRSDVYAKLASRPGKHAIIATYKSQKAAYVRLWQVRNGRVKSANAQGDFDGYVIKNEAGTYDLYLRKVVDE